MLNHYLAALWDNDNQPLITQQFTQWGWGKDSNTKNKLRNYSKNSNLGGEKSSTIILSNLAFLT